MIQSIIAQTPRLLLKELTIDDAENLYLLNLDPEVIKYTGDKPFGNINEAKIFLENYDHYNKYGYGRWAVIRKSDKAFLGWCGLKYTPDVNEYDIGFRLFKSYWNKGFATEAAAACLKLGFEKYEINEILGRAMKSNKASIIVLEKIGLKFRRNFDFGSQEGLIYSINRL
jgi:[ribosomal protein S5]-alanine N-acetyltransferase